MKKYIATVEVTGEDIAFEILFDTDANLLVSDNDDEIYDMNGEAVTDKALVELVYALYNTFGFEITDCIEYED